MSSVEDKIAELTEQANDKNNPYVQIYKNKIDSLLKMYQQAQQENARLQLQLDETLGVVGTPPKIPEWIDSKADTSNNIPVLLCSDFHYGENVNPNEVPNGNCYSPNVANARWDRLIDRTIRKINSRGKNTKGMIVCFLGDDVSGDIHEELKETNHKTPLDACMDVAGQ